MAAYSAKWFNLEQRSVIIFLVVEKSKTCEIYEKRVMRTKKQGLLKKKKNIN